jgi:hypothetical protein
MSTVNDLMNTTPQGSGGAALDMAKCDVVLDYYDGQLKVWPPGAATPEDGIPVASLSEELQKQALARAEELRAQRKAACRFKDDKDDPRRAFIFRASSPNISPAAFKLAWLLCYKYGNKHSMTCPGQDTLAADLGVSDRHVRRLQDEPETIGLRNNLRPGPRKGTTVSRYSFDGPIIPDMGVRNRAVIPDMGVRNWHQNCGHTCPEIRTWESA